MRGWARISILTPRDRDAQVILSADMSVETADMTTLIKRTGNDFPLNTVAGMQNEVENNGYTLTLLNGDLAYADGYLCEHTDPILIHTPKNPTCPCMPVSA
jgi:hypothetical protein